MLPDYFFDNDREPYAVNSISIADELYPCDRNRKLRTVFQRVLNLQNFFLTVKITNCGITDENHHSKAASYRRIYDAYPSTCRVGVTATPIRLDGSGLVDVNDDLIIGVSAKWLIEHHCLAPYDYYAPDIADLSTVKVRRGEFDAREAEKVMLERKVYGDVISYYSKLAKGMQAVYGG